MRTDCRDAQPVTVRNVSSHGVGLKANPPPPVGARVSVRLRDYGYVGGTVRWSEHGSFGVLLDTVIDLERFQFSSEAWSNVVPKADPNHVIDYFKPETSTWRPGFNR
jgi:hypothetical protein